jgi:hypothetical protein
MFELLLSLVIRLLSVVSTAGRCQMAWIHKRARNVDACSQDLCHTARLLDAFEGSEGYVKPQKQAAMEPKIDYSTQPLLIHVNLTRA